MARERKVTVEHMLIVAAVTSGGLAVGLGDATGLKFAGLLLGMLCATAIGVLAIRRAVLRVDLFECGYRAGWADAAHEFTPYPSEPTSHRVVVPMRRSPS